MKIRISELRTLIQEVLTEAMTQHARFAQATFDRVKEILTDEYESISPIKGENKGDWTIPGEQFGIPEFSNVDFFFTYEDPGFEGDENLGMYKAPETYNRSNRHDLPHNVPEENRRYRVVMSYGPYMGDRLWSKQMFLRNIAKALDRDTWYHEIGHILTARKVPTKPHVKNFFKAASGAGDYEEVLGMFIQQFQQFFDKFDGCPEQFKLAYPTFDSFIDTVEKHLDWHSANLRRSHEKQDDLKKRTERWFLKKAHQVYTDLSDE